MLNCNCIVLLCIFMYCIGLLVNRIKMVHTGTFCVEVHLPLLPYAFKFDILHLMDMYRCVFSLAVLQVCLR